MSTLPPAGDRPATGPARRPPTGARPARARRRGPWFDLLAMAAIGAVIVAAALLPAVTANAGGTTTIRGDVTAGGQPLAFFPVGFWTTTGGVVVSTQTDSNGGFTLDVSSTLDGYAFAGTAPDSQQAIISIDGTQYVRGILGAKVAAPVSSPLYQGWDTATAHGLAAGAAHLHFLLQQPGTLSGTSPVRGSALRSVQVRRLDGSVVQTLRVDSRGRFVSRELVPGDYAVALLPTSPALAEAVRATVRAGVTTQVALPAPATGASVFGTLTADGKAVAAGVPVLLEQNAIVVAGTTTGTAGAYRFTGLAAGDYGLEFGRYAETGSIVPSPSQSPEVVPIPGVTASPTPTPTPTPTPSATTGPQAALQPTAHTSDAVIPGTATVTVPATLEDVATTNAVDPAGRIAGVVSGADGADVQVVAEDASTGQILRSTTATSGGQYSIGGMVVGTQYRIAAVSRPTDPTLARTGVTTAFATQATTGADITLDTAAASLSGTVAGAVKGTVTVGDDAVFARTAPLDDSGAYVVLGLVPGAYPVTVATTDKLTSTPVGVDVNGAAQLDLAQGPSPATFKGWFISGGAGVPRVIGTATDPEGDQISFGPNTDGGYLTERGLRPGTYTYDGGSFISTVPALDGPWWFDAPTGSFSLSDGSVKNVGPVVLHLRAR